MPNERLDDVVIEVVLGSDPKRPLRDALCRSMQPGDVLIVADLVHLAGNLADLNDAVVAVTGGGARLEVLNEDMVIGGDAGQPCDAVGMIAALARWQREVWRERHAEGVLRAKSRGVYARSRTRKLDDGQLAEIMAMIDRGESKTTISRQFGLSRQSLYKYLRKAS